MTDALLQFRDFSAGYADSPVLRNINFAAEPGQNIGILGANGSGKTTLLRSVAGQTRVFAGALSINAVSTYSLSAKKRARMLAATEVASSPQPGLTVQQYTLLGRYPWLGWLGRYDAKDYEIAGQALAATGLAAFASQEIATLSAGQWRLANLARCLAQIWSVERPILLLDEQTANLDINHKFAITFLLEKWRKRPGLIIQAMHDCNLAALSCTHLLGLKNGNQVFFGSIEEVFTAEFLSDLYDWPLAVSKHPFLDAPQAYALFSREQCLSFRAY